MEKQNSDIKHDEPPPLTPPPPLSMWFANAIKKIKLKIRGIE